MVRMVPRKTVLTQMYNKLHQCKTIHINNCIILLKLGVNPAYVMKTMKQYII